jgi:hypothetical protein
MFLYYLAKKLGPEIVNKIWTMSDKKENPLQAIERILMQETGCKFVSPSPNDDDIFASGYCMDSYFLQDVTNAGYIRNIFLRHGERAVSESLYLSLDEEQAVEDGLDHLACRYYRIYPESQVTNLKVRLLIPEDQGPSTLKAELAVVTKQMKRDSVYKLYLVPRSASSKNFIQLFAEINQIALNDIDHFVLVVSNCGTRGAQRNPYIEHDDGKQYRIIVKAF